jgi:hypothetical protein
MTRTEWMGGAVLWGVMGLACLTAQAQSNMCHNGSFTSTSTNGPLDGWNINYAWTENSIYAANHTRISYLPEFKGKKNVMQIGMVDESKFETPLVPYEPGARYKCTFDFYSQTVYDRTSEGSARVLFLGYAWRPGMAPNEAPKLQDMRRIYKGDPVSARGASWKTVTVTFPHEQISELAWNHLKKVRYVTVMVLFPSPTVGNAYITNVKMVKLADKCKVTKGPVKPSVDDE